MIIDIAYVILIIFAAVKGMRKGLIVALFSMFAFVAGLAAALKLSAVVAARLSTEVSPAFKWLPMLSFLIVFILVAFLVNLGGKIIQKAVETVLMGWINRVGGMLLYLALYTFIFSIILFFASQAHLINTDTIAASFFYPYIQPLGPKVIDAIGDLIPFFKNMFAELQKFFGGLSNKM
jgi:membrane protein required for colicin V production